MAQSLILPMATGLGAMPVASFVTGLRIMTDLGFVAVNALRPGDLIVTLEAGLLPLRRCARHTVPSQGDDAAVSIPAGTFGDHGALRVSPRHRLLIAGWQVQPDGDDGPVLVRADHLARAGLLRQDHSGCPVTYHHLVFDSPGLLNAEGLWSDCYQPGPMTRHSQHPVAMLQHDPSTPDAGSHNRLLQRGAVSRAAIR